MAQYRILKKIILARSGVGAVVALFAGCRTGEAVDYDN